MGQPGDLKRQEKVDTCKGIWHTEGQKTKISRRDFTCNTMREHVGRRDDNPERKVLARGYRHNCRDYEPNLFVNRLPRTRRPSTSWDRSVWLKRHVWACWVNTKVRVPWKQNWKLPFFGGFIIVKKQCEVDTEDELNVHIESVHQNDLFKFSCKLCNFKTKGPRLLRQRTAWQ